jgi:hypothetical protein
LNDKAAGHRHRSAVPDIRVMHKRTPVRTLSTLNIACQKTFVPL